jgi:nitrate reductase molybdenum cofactor assembly chaperone NarJ/NarW
MSIYKALSILIEYPSEEMRANLFAIRSHAVASGALDAERVAELDRFIAYAGSIDLIDLQAEYVQTFDLTPENSLHLTHHIFGDDKNRGPALIDLTEHYRKHGLAVDGNELPDYLPLILEFAHSVGDDEANSFLADAGKVLRVLAGNLQKARSPWLPLLLIVLHVAGQDGPIVTDTECSTSCESAATCGAAVD